MNLVELSTKETSMNYKTMREIGMIARCIQTMTDNDYKAMNLEKGQFLFVARVCENPGISQERLSYMLKVDKTTTAKAIKKLIIKDYIYKKQNKNDKRAFELYPTEQAQNIYGSIREIENNATEIALNTLTETEQELVYELLKKIRFSINKEWESLKKNKKNTL